MRNDVYRNAVSRDKYMRARVRFDEVVNNAIRQVEFVPRLGTDSNRFRSGIFRPPAP